MPARRFFIEGVQQAGAHVVIDASDAHKIAHVLRLRAGDAIDAVDSSGTLYRAQLTCVGERVEARLLVAEPGDATASLQVEVAQALPKGSKMDAIVEKATELGAAAIRPFRCERSIAREAGAGKLERWRRVARSAAAQCGRRDVPRVEEPVDFAALLEGFAAYDAVLFPWELAERRPLRTTLPPLLAQAGRVLAVIGPEGGFAHGEAEAARARGAHLLWLGPRILRTETAALALLAVIEALR